MPATPATTESLAVGDIEVSFLPDGIAAVSETALFPTAGQELWDAHQELYDENGKLILSLGSFLIRTAGRNILVDLGFGDQTVEIPAVGGEFRSGRLLASLREVGLGPEDIDTVFFTHLHIDHVGWTVHDGGLTFPRARHLAGEGELEFWRDLDDPGLAAVGPDRESTLGPLLERGDAVADGSSLAPGVTVVATPGHTPGHCSLALGSGPDRAVLLGDVLHCPVQLTDNDVSMAFDADPELARRTRDRITAELEDDPSTVAAQGHFPGSVFGRILRGTARRSWSHGIPSERRASGAAPRTP